MEVPDVYEEEEEIELSLGLSIGGRDFKKFEKKSNDVHQKSISSITFDFQICRNDTESRMENDNSSPSCVCSLSVDDGECEAVLDPEKMRREIHKMRRQEARKKQLQKKNGRKDFDLMTMRNEDEDGSEQQICKKLKSEEEDDVVGEEKEQSLNEGLNLNPFPTMPMQYGFQSMQYVPFGNGFVFPYHHMMQGCWIPPASCSDLGDNNAVVHPIACRSFQPIQVENSLLNGEVKVKNCDFEQTLGKCGGDKAATRSSGSAGSSSSAVSDYRNGSQHGGSCSETRSHSSQSPPPEQPRSNVPVMSNVQVQSELNTSSNPTKSTLVFETPNTNTNNIICSNTAQSNLSKTEEKQVPVIDPYTIDKTNSVTDYLPPAFLRPNQHLKGGNVENFKPPKPQPPRLLKRTNEKASNPLISEPPRQPTGTNGESNLITPKLTQPPQLLKRTNEEASKPFIPEPPHQLMETNGENNLTTPKLIQPQTESLPKMPCVTTVGNGPNGKTVTGFLYRYTKTEVSIICVCHGSSFSPAEFVKHAGGTDVSHPLKHIVVVPSAQMCKEEGS